VKGASVSAAAKRGPKKGEQGRRRVQQGGKIKEGGATALGDQRKTTRWTPKGKEPDKVEPNPRKKRPKESRSTPCGKPKKERKKTARVMKGVDPKTAKVREE